MFTLDELVNTEDPGWPVVKEWIDQATNKVEVLPCERIKAEEALVNAQVNTRSLMGAVIYETGGVLIDNGWIRILGAGSERMKRSLPGWNRGKTFSEYGQIPPYLLIADDAVGGLFAINGGFLGKDRGQIHYFAPDTLQWESLDIGYSQFLMFCFGSNIDRFYSTLRWKGWEEDIKLLDPDYGYIFYPYLWAKEGKDMNTISRRVVPMQEIYDFNIEMKSTLDKL